MELENAAPVSDQQETPAAPAPAPPSPAPTYDVARIERGMQELAAHNRYLQQQMQQMNADRAAEQQRQAQAAREAEEARIANLPPIDQANARAELARRENAELRAFLSQSLTSQRQAAAPQVQDRYSEQLTPAQIEARKAEIVAYANEHYGLSGERALTVTDIDAEFQSDEAAFVAALKVIGTERKKTGTQNSEAPDVAKQQSAQTAPKAQTNGAHRPMSPQPNAPARSVDSSQLQSVLSDSTIKTPKQRAAKLAELRAEAAAKLR